MNFLDDVIDERYCEHIHQNVLDGNVMNMSLIIMKEIYGAIDAGDFVCHGYFIINFSSSPYNLQADLSIDGEVISSGKIVFEGTYFFPININHHYHVLQKTKSINTTYSISTIINGNINVICYFSKDFIPLCLRHISHNYYNILSPLRISMKEHDNIMDENNLRESIDFYISVSLGIQYITSILK